MLDSQAIIQMFYQETKPNKPDMITPPFKKLLKTDCDSSLIIPILQ